MGNLFLEASIWMELAKETGERDYPYGKLISTFKEIKEHKVNFRKIKNDLTDYSNWINRAIASEAYIAGEPILEIMDKSFLKTKEMVVPKIEIVLIL